MRPKSILLAGATLFLLVWTVRASAPISGQTLAFASAADALGDTASAVNALSAADFDRDSDPDALSGHADGRLILWENAGGTWVSTPISATASAVNALSAADFDRDSDPDALSGHADGRLILWENTGGTWVSTPISATASAVNALSAADFDRDGDPDALSGHTDGRLILWENTGGTWVSTPISATASAVNALSAADFDRDGDLDALSAHADGRLTLWEQSATGWHAHLLGNAPAPAAALRVADLDGDGDLDVASGSGDASGRLTVWENNGSPFGGAWPSAAAGTVGSPVADILLGDFDHDGDADLLSGASSGAIHAWQNGGAPFSGGWSALALPSGAEAVHALAALDADLDGDEDFLSGHAQDASAAEVRLRRNTRDHLRAAFAAAPGAAGSTGGNTVYGLTAADLDNDGDPDLASGEVGGTLRVWENDGDPFGGAWGGATAGNVGGGAWVLAVHAADLDGDGDPDLVTGNTGGAVRAWTNDGTPFAGTWAQTVVGTTSGGANGVALGDLDNDGDPDIVSAHSVGASAEVIAWRNEGGSWTRFDVGTHDADMNAVFLADLDGDGDLDIASSSTSSSAAGEVIVWRNNGLGNPWTRQDVGERGTYVFALGAADLDGDGDPDLVTGDGARQVIAWQNDGTPFAGTWTSATLGTTAHQVRSLTLADWNADGRPDVLTGAGNGNTGGTVRLWLNGGAPFSGGWSSFLLGTTGDNPNALPAADLDGDGDPDFGVGFSSDTDVPYEAAVWAFTGGQTAFQVTDTSPSSPAYIPNGTEDDLLQITLEHNGQSGEAAAEWAQSTFTLLQGDCATPLTTAQANAFIEALRVRRDDGDGVFEDDGSDPLIGEAATLALDSAGRQTLLFGDGDAHAQVGAANSAVFWVSLLATADADQQSPNNLCLRFDPDADALVEGKYTSGDAGLSIADSAPADTGNTPTVIALQDFSARTASPLSVWNLFPLLAAAAAWRYLRRRRVAASGPGAATP